LLQQIPCIPQLIRYKERMQNMKLLLASIAITTALAACKSGESNESGEGAREASEKEAAASSEHIVTDLAMLAGSEWNLIDLCGEPMPEDASINLLFYEEGRISGSASVNRYNSPIRIVDGVIQQGPVAVTRMAGPPELMERESAYLAAISTAQTIQLVGDDQLIITVENKEYPLLFEAAPQP